MGETELNVVVLDISVVLSSMVRGVSTQIVDVWQRHYCVVIVGQRKEKIVAVFMLFFLLSGYIHAVIAHSKGSIRWCDT